jgi:hypothetical protein
MWRRFATHDPAVVGRRGAGCAASDVVENLQAAPFIDLAEVDGHLCIDDECRHPSTFAWTAMGERLHLPSSLVLQQPQRRLLKSIGQLRQRLP